MNESEIIALLTLQNTPNIGGITAKKLISKLGSASEIFRTKRNLIEKIEGIGTIITSHLFNPQYYQEAQKEWEYICKNNIQFSTYQDADYPINLSQAVDSPIIIFKKGNIDFNNKKIISIVGTRQVTSYGIAFCEKFIEDLVPLKDELIIVSGYAYGVDITAHKKAMELDIQTIACLAHGLDTIYPSAHKRYCEQMLENGGFLTDFWHKSKFDRKNFLSRNRIIAGLADATIVVESAIKGGSLVTADIAFSYDREVFAVPGRVTDVYSVGCNHLIRNEKARVLTCVNDLLYAMNWDTQNTKPKQLVAEFFIDFSDEEKIIYDYLKTNGKQQFDTIARELKIPVHKLLHLLFTMEMKGGILPLPGKIFSVQ